MTSIRISETEVIISKFAIKLISWILGLLQAAIVALSIVSLRWVISTHSTIAVINHKLSTTMATQVEFKTHTKREDIHKPALERLQMQIDVIKEKE